MIYRFKIWFKEDQDITRWIDIQPHQTFLDLHNAIVQSINFRVDEPSSFYMSDEKWDKGFEIAKTDMGLDEKDTPVSLMQDGLLSMYINQPKQRFVYVTDFIEMWTLHIEFFDTVESNSLITYPNLYKTTGKAFKNL